MFDYSHSNLRVFNDLPSRLLIRLQTIRPRLDRHCRRLKRGIISRVLRMQQFRQTRVGNRAAFAAVGKCLIRLA